MHASRNPENGLVYRGCELVHVSDGFRGDVGTATAHYIDQTMRADAVADGLLTSEQVYGEGAEKLCPGCYMPVLFNAARQLALENGQSLSELGRTMAAQFAKLAEGDTGAIEDIHVYLDDEPMDTALFAHSLMADLTW